MHRTLHYDGRLFEGHPAADKLSLKEKVGVGEVPRCNENTDESTWTESDPVALWVIDGIDPDTAMGTPHTDGAFDTIWLDTELAATYEDLPPEVLELLEE